MTKNKIIFTILSIGFLVSSQTISVQTRKRFPLPKKAEQVLYMPSGKYLKVAALGYDQMLADFIWVKTISYFGFHAMTDREYSYLPNLLEAVTALDPYWYFPYNFAGVVLSVEADYVETANQILRRGMGLFPERWQIPFYIGFNYFHVLNDPTCGSKYIYMASTMEGSPTYLRPLAVKLSAKGNTQENHIEMCRKILSMTKEEDIREKIIDRCKERISHVPDESSIKQGVCQ